MAKAKKQEKPIEQRLEEALVLYEKTPYELPKNWCWVKLEDLTNITAGGTPARNNHRYWDNGQIPWVKISDLSGKYVETTEERITQLGLDNSSAKIFKKGTILYTIFATIGEVAILNIDAATNQAIAGITCKEPYNLDYMYYVLLVLKDLLVSKAKGVAQVNINQSILKETPIPLAPIEEQKRIVEIIEKQFAKLDEARDLIQKSLDSFADRKFAILHKAFTGELTKQWRENNSVIQRKNTVNFLDCIEDMQNGISKRNGKEGKDFIVLRLADLKENRISTDDNRTIKLTETEIKKYQLKENDIIMIRVNGSKEYVGRQILFNMECACAYCDHIIRIQYRKDISPKFMLYFSQTREYKDYILQNLVSSAGQNTISRKGLSRLKLNLSLFEEQEEIVRILDSIFEKEDKSKELLDMLDTIDEMKKSILARAFRGELGTSNHTDEPATDLLKKILEQNN